MQQSIKLTEDEIETAIREYLVKHDRLPVTDFDLYLETVLWADGGMGKLSCDDSAFWAEITITDKP